VTAKFDSRIGSFKNYVYEWLSKGQAIAIIKLMQKNPFVNDIIVTDQEGNVAHYESKVPAIQREVLIQLIQWWDEPLSKSEFCFRTNETWEKIVAQRKEHEHEMKAKYPDKQRKWFKGKLMVKGVNCMLHGGVRADGAEFPPDCESWWQQS